MDKYTKVARDIIISNLKVKSSERVLVVCDKGTESFGRAFFDACQEEKIEGVMVVIPTTRTDGAEPPQSLRNAMLAANVIIAVTTYTLTHGKATKEALKNGARVLSIPNLNEEIFLSKSMKGSQEMVLVTNRISELLSAGVKAELTTPLGTKLSFEMGGWDRVGGADTGVIEDQGILANLPAGESLISPIEGTMNGRIVIDASISGGIGLLQEQIVLIVKNGTIVSIEGGEQAEKLKQVLNDADDNAFNIAEVAFGINPEAKVIGNIIIDEKTLGTAHVGIGNSKMLGGNIYSNIHLDAVFYNPSLSVDNHTIINGTNLITDTAPWETLDFVGYEQMVTGNIRLISDYVIDEKQRLFKKWKDVMGRNHITRVGDESASERCAIVIKNLSDKEIPINEILALSKMDIKEGGRVINMLLRFRLVECI